MGLIKPAHLTLGELISVLEAADLSKVVHWGFGSPHSYRGYYEQLAFEPAEDVSVYSMLDEAKGALNQTFEGYKGGDFKMKEYTYVWLSEYGTEGESLGAVLLSYMLESSWD